MSDSSIVYWALFVEPNKFAERALLTEPPKQVMSDLKHIYNPNSGVFRCPSVKEKHLNTFVYKLPFEVTVSTMGGTGFYSQYDNVTPRPPMYKEGFSFDINYQLIFYSFEDLMLQTSPPYFHQTSYSSLGHIPSGQFNIGKWFRPSAPNVSVFPKIDVFKAIKDDPLIYYNFVTDKRVVLKQFFLTDLLLNIALDSVDHKQFIPNQPLQDLYNRVTKGKVNKVIQKEILDNLLD
jgi:hypothetical protein